MAEKDEAQKKTPVTVFREKLSDPQQIKQNISDGIKSTNAAVRALAAKAALKSQDYAFIKQHVLPLIKSEKSKKVLRTISRRMTRKDLAQKVKSMMVKKAVPAKTADAAQPAAEEKKAE